MDTVRKPQSASDIRIINRKQIDISGVDEIFSYDESSIVLSVCGTRTVVEGEDLRVTVLSVGEGRICAVGRIDAVVCEEAAPSGKGFFARLFRS